MSDAGMSRIRWGFGPRVAITNEEAALDTTPLLQSESSLHADRVGGCSSPTLNTDHNNSTPPHPVSLTITESPIIHSLSLPAVVPDSSSMRSVLQSFSLGNLYRSIDHHSVQMALQADEGAYALPNHILAPVLGDLQKLKALTPESLPSYNPGFNIKSHAQVLKERLLPIGKFITDYLDGVPEGGRGILELRICRYIAYEYWPLPIDNFTYLKIQEKYRNALYKMAQRTPNRSAIGLPPPGDTFPEDTSTSHASPEVAAHKHAPPADSSPNSTLSTSPPMFGKDTLSQNTIAISAEAAASAEKRDLNL